MTETDKPEFVAALAELALLRPAGLKLTSAHYAAWWNLMRQEWTLQEFKRACAKLAQSVDDYSIGPQHFAQLRKAAATDAVAEAWERVLRTIRSMHPSDAPSIDARTDRVVRAMGGYRQLAMTDSSQLHTWSVKRFAELWEELGEVAEARAVLPALAPSRRIRGPQRLLEGA